MKRIKKQRHHFANKGPYSQSYGFSSSRVWMWELDVKKAECQGIDALKLFWRRLLRLPWTPRRANQSILKEISPEYSLEGLMLKLKLQYFGHLMWRTDSLGKTLMLGKIEGRRRKWQRMRWLGSISDSVDTNLNKLWGIMKDREAWRAAVHRAATSQTWLSNQTTATSEKDSFLKKSLSILFYPFLLKNSYHSFRAKFGKYIGNYKCCYCCC